MYSRQHQMLTQEEVNEIMLAYKDKWARVASDLRKLSSCREAQEAAQMLENYLEPAGRKND